MTRLARPFAIGGLLLAIIGAGGMVFVRISAPAEIIGGFGFGEAAMVGYAIAGLAWASAGGVLVVRRSDNAVGWLMVVVGVGYALSQLTVSLAFAFAAEGSVEGGRRAQLAGWVTVLLQLVTILQFAIAFLFPTGRPQSRGWARFMRVFWTFAAVFVALSLTQPGPLQLIPALDNPFGFGPDLRGGRPIAPILGAFTLILFVGLGFSMVSRYRSAGRVERQQLKWFVLAAGLSAIGLGIVTWEVIIMGRDENAIGLVVYVFAGALVPLAIGIAILRYHLYDLDRIVSRTVAYGLVLGVMGATFVGVIFLLQFVLARVTGGETIAVAASTLVVYLLFQPILRPIRRAVDRRFDRARYDADLTAIAFSERLREETDLGAVTADLTRTTSGALAPALLAVWIRVAGR